MKGSAAPWDLVIVGAGPAGLSAQIQSARLGLRTLVLEKHLPGGQLRYARKVDNYPGVAGVAGERLADKLVEHAVASGMNWRRAEVNSIEVASRGNGGHSFHLAVQSKGEAPEASDRRIKARSVILAVGQAPTNTLPSLAPLGPKLLIPGTLIPRDWTGKSVLIIGGGDVAFDQGLALADHGAKNVVIVCRKAPRALPCLVAQAHQRGLVVIPKMTPLEAGTDPEPWVAFCPTPQLGSPFSPNSPKNPAHRTIHADGVLLAIGKTPCPPPIIDTQEKCLTLGDGNLWGECELAGLLVAGDLRRDTRRQAALAAGDGVAATLAAHRYLLSGL